jgi:hypothetical protein
MQVHAQLICASFHMKAFEFDNICHEQIQMTIKVMFKQFPILHKPENEVRRNLFVSLIPCSHYIFCFPSCPERSHISKSSGEKTSRRRAFELLKEFVKTLGQEDILIADVPNIVVVNNVQLVLKGLIFDILLKIACNSYTNTYTIRRTYHTHNSPTHNHQHTTTNAQSRMHKHECVHSTHAMS